MLRHWVANSMHSPSLFPYRTRRSILGRQLLTDEPTRTQCLAVQRRCARSKAPTLLLACQTTFHLAVTHAIDTWV